jgi:quinol monooxygenase YgiN
LQFDVLSSAETDSNVVFYEVYASKQAFENHLSSPHVDIFRKALPEHVQTEYPVRFLERH